MELVEWQVFQNSHNAQTDLEECKAMDHSLDLRTRNEKKRGTRQIRMTNIMKKEEEQEEEKMLLMMMSSCCSGWCSRKDAVLLSC